VRVLVTGGTGFVGSYTVPALLARGHEVRLLVRDQAKAATVLARRGVDVAADPRIELARGDMLDAAAVGAAAAGCDATIHSAAAIGVTSGGAVPVTEQNVGGTRTVVGAAIEAGHDPVVHISTIAVFLPPSEPVITTESPLASPRNEYGRSKVEAERWVRELQAQGHPVTIVYPGGVLGPDQPSLDATLEGIAGARRQGWPNAPGGVCLIDVRDLADALSASIEPGRGPRRFLLGGPFMTWPQLGDLCDELTGVKARRVPFPQPVILALGSLLDLARRVRPIAYPLTRDAAEIMVKTVPTDDQPTLDALGLALRPTAETVEDALRWLAREGHLAPKHAGRLAP
jgi:nucleoside-diphosphate-sugar epimerase